jgi:hypothetical protein
VRSYNSRKKKGSRSKSNGRPQGQGRKKEAVQEATEDRKVKEESKKLFKRTAKKSRLGLSRY